MPATFVNAGTGVFTIAGEDYSCQVTSFDPTRTDVVGSDSGSTELTACGTPLPSDKQNGAYVGSVKLGIVHDWQATGVSRALAAAVGEEAELAVTLDEGTAHERTYAATVVLPAVPDSWTPGKLERADLTLQCKALTGPTFTP